MSSPRCCTWHIVFLLWLFVPTCFKIPKKFLIGHKIYPKTVYVNFWPLGVTLNLKVEMQVLWMTHCLIIVTICGQYLQNLSIYKKVMDWHKIYPISDYVNLWPPSVTLILEVGDRLLRMAHCLIIVNNCDKYLQNPFTDKKVMDRTRHIPSNRQYWPWMSATLTLE
jgi:hypothetical protein